MNVSRGQPSAENILEQAAMAESVDLFLTFGEGFPKNCSAYEKLSRERDRIEANLAQVEQATALSGEQTAPDQQTIVFSDSVLVLAALKLATKHHPNPILRPYCSAMLNSYENARVVYSSRLSEPSN